MIPIFRAKILDEKLQILNRGMWRDHLKSFRPGMLVEVIVRKPKEVIVDQLRKYYFKVVAKILSDHTGHSKEKVHDIMKIKFASEEDPVTGLLMIDSVFSNDSEMSEEEKEAFILEVRNWASDFFNLVIPERQRVDY